MFERFGEAGFVSCGDFEAVLDDVDFFGEFFEGGRFVGAVDLFFEKDAEVSLAVEEGEEFGWLGICRDWDGEENEDLLI